MERVIDPSLRAEDPGMVPRFSMDLAPPDLSRWRQGSHGIPGFYTRAGDRSGPHVLIVALTHGNELAGAIVLNQLLQADLRPLRGTLTMGFANLAAFDRFDPAQPTASRYVEEDFNRLWDPAVLDGPRTSLELSRAREMRPLVDRADVLLDLHSMLWASEPLLLCGASAKGRALAEGIGTPELVVADGGHLSGPRLIDYGRFADRSVGASAALVEAGQHWERDSVSVTLACVAGLLRLMRMARLHPSLPPPRVPGRRRYARVTRTVTAGTAGFAFVQQFRGGEVVPRAETLIARDGELEIRTPHDDCLLVMPSLRPSRGHTAVRLARFEP